MSRQSPAWLLPAIREEADWMGRHFKATVPSALPKCTAWHTLARRSPILNTADLFNSWAQWHEDVSFSVEWGWSESEVALRVVFCQAVYYATNRVRAFSESELEKEAEEYRKQANRLREEAAKLRKGWAERSEAHHHAAALDAAARHCDEQAEWVWGSAYGTIVKKHQEDPIIRGYCMVLVEKIREMYGAELRGSVANIANCSGLGAKTLTDQRIRDWIKGAVS